MQINGSEEHKAKGLGRDLSHKAIRSFAGMGAATDMWLLWSIMIVAQARFTLLKQIGKAGLPGMEFCRHCL